MNRVWHHLLGEAYLFQAEIGKGSSAHDGVEPLRVEPAAADIEGGFRF